MAAIGGRIRGSHGTTRAARLVVPLALALALLLGAGLAPALAGQATLAWDANTEPEVTGYKIHYGTASGSYGTHLDVGTALTHTVTGLTDGQTYYFAATAYDSVGNESAYSNEVSYTVPGIPEMNLLGNAVVIIDGDATPSGTDHTDFGSAAVGGAAVTRTFTIQNTGSGPLTLSGSPPVAIGGANAGDFAVTAPPAATVAAGASTTFTVSFTPGAAGPRAATISVASNDADENPYNFSIAGSGAATPEIVVLGKGASIADGDASPSGTDDTDFGKTKLSGGVVARTFTIQNTGSGPLNLSSPLVAISGPGAGDFTLTAPPAATVAAGASTTFTVSFDPGTSGARGATLTITSNDADEGSFDFAVQGAGVAPPGAPKNIRTNQ